MNLRNNLSKILKQAKKDSGVTYDQLVESSGYSKSTIRYALNGGSKTSIDVFESLFKSCGVTTIYIDICFDSNLGD